MQISQVFKVFNREMLEPFRPIVLIREDERVGFVVCGGSYLFLKL